MKIRRITIKYIAEMAEVSKATASLVLNGRGKELRVAQEIRPQRRESLKNGQLIGIINKSEITD